MYFKIEETDKHRHACTHIFTHSSPSEFTLFPPPRPESLLAELQLAFICFLVGQVWEGWEHWRKLVLALCSAEEFICQNPALYEKFLSALHFQVHEVCDGN